MKKTIFRGAGVALVTPMNSDGSVNYAKLKELVDFQIENDHIVFSETAVMEACCSTLASCTTFDRFSC